MPTPFQKNMAWSTVAHLGIIGLLAFAMGFTPSEKKLEPIQWLDLNLPSISEPGQSSPLESSPPPDPEAPVPSEPIAPPEPVLPEPPPVPPAPPVVEPEPQSPIHDPIAPPKPEPPKKTPPKTTLPVKPTPPVKNPPKPKEPKIKISTTKVIRPRNGSTPSPTPKTPTKTTSSNTGFDPKKFSENLLGKLPPGTVSLNGQTGSGHSPSNTNDYGWYTSHIMQEMYGAWHPPIGVIVNVPVVVLLRVDKNGMILKVSLATSSGNRLMDDSALTAANSIKKLKPLPKGLGPDFEDITVNFKVQHP